MKPGAFLRLGPLLALAFTPLATAAPAPATAVPELFAGEIEDVGPQFLLLSAPRPQPLELWADLEFTGTSNATLVETDPKSSTITSAQAGASWHFGNRPLRGGQLSFEGGFKVQAYRYGLVTGPTQVINFLEIDRNDFDLLGAHLQAAWRRGGWLATTTLRASSMRNRTTNRVFYQEAALEWQAFHQWRLNPRRSWIFGVDGAVRGSHTDSYGLLPAGWNNRYEHSIVALLDQQIGASWHLQPTVRVLGTCYSHRDRDRTDIHGSARLSFSRPLGSTAEFRCGFGYDRRNSSEAAIADFRKWDLTLASSAHWRF